jgi:transposase
LDEVSSTFGVFFMTKHDERFKLKVVQQYESGAIGTRRLAALHGISAGDLNRWIAAYKRHGMAGLRHKGASYDAAFKLLVLEQMWNEQWSLGQTAAVFDIRCPSHIGRWERQYHEGGLDALNPRPRGRPKKMTTPEPPKSLPPQPEDPRTLEQLRKENEYLRAEVAYLKKLRALRQAKEQAAQKKRG